jgi:hypothetical protein
MPASSTEPKSGAVAAPKLPPNAEAHKEEERLGAKLRRKGDIMHALRSGSTLVLTPEGLYRMLNLDSSRNPVSKRRAASIVAAGLVKLTKTGSDGKHYIVDPQAEKKSQRHAEATEPESK